MALQIRRGSDVDKGVITSKAGEPSLQLTQNDYT